MTDLQSFTLMMASAQVVEASVNTNNSPSQDYTANPDDHSNHNIDSPGFKPFTVIYTNLPISRYPVRQKSNMKNKLKTKLCMHRTALRIFSPVLAPERSEERRKNGARTGLRGFCAVSKTKILGLSSAQSMISAPS